jgi:hypothetical protein
MATFERARDDGLTHSGHVRDPGADLVGGVLRDLDRVSAAGVCKPVLRGCRLDCYGGRCAGVWVCTADALAGALGKQAAQYQGKAVTCFVAPPLRQGM